MKDVIIGIYTALFIWQFTANLRLRKMVRGLRFALGELLRAGMT